MLKGMTVSQFREWMAYGELEPFDEVRSDIRTAQVVQALLNTVGRGNRRKAYPLEDCLLKFGREPEPDLTPDQRRKQIQDAMMVLMQIHNTPDRKA
jgi:hypothetical protein